jgi:hypothetical protein
MSDSATRRRRRMSLPKSRKRPDAISVWTRSSDKRSIRLRHTRNEELKDLPPRPEQVFYAPLAEKKAEAYPE